MCIILNYKYELYILVLKDHIKNVKFEVRTIFFHFTIKYEMPIKKLK